MRQTKGKILALSVSELKTLTDIAAEKLAEMEHGLETVLDPDDNRMFLTIRVNCEAKNGDETLLRVPFRSFVNIPMV